MLQDSTSDVRTIRLGEELDEASFGHGHAVVLRLDSLRRHLGILGRSGAGKSFTGMVLASELLHHSIPVLVLDRTGEFSDSLEGLDGLTVYEPGRNLSVSPFVGVDGSLADSVERAVSLMEHHLQVTIGSGLTPLQARILRDALTNCFSSLKPDVTFSDLLNQLRLLQERAKYLKGWSESVEAIASRLHPFSSGALAKVFDTAESTLAAEQVFERGAHVVNLGLIETDEAKNLLSQVLCKKIFDYGRSLGPTKDLRFVLVVDEAHHLAPNRVGYYSVLERYAIELRKYGMGLVVIATRPTLVSENILANCNTIICHSLTSSRDIDLALNYMVNKLEADRYMGELRVLDVGEAFVQLNDKHMTTPLHCKIGLPEHGFLLKEQVRTIPQAAANGKPIPSLNDLLPDMDDSSWLVYDRLPPWATKAAALAYKNRGIVLLSKLKEHGFNQRQVKDMVHGPHPIFLEKDFALHLTKLGEKIGLIELTGKTDENGHGGAI